MNIEVQLDKNPRINYVYMNNAFYPETMRKHYVKT